MWPWWSRAITCARMPAGISGTPSSRCSPRSPSSGSSAPRSRSESGSAEPLVGVDQVLLAGGLLAVDRDLLEPQGARERDFLGVRARERGLDLGRDPLTQLLGGLEADLLQEGGEQPAADPPGHAEGAVELGGPAFEAAVDIDLLVSGGAVPAVLLRGPVGRDLHGGGDLPGPGAAPAGVEAPA